jgi:hypothetical protein
MRYRSTGFAIGIVLIVRATLVPNHAQANEIELVQKTTVAEQALIFASGPAARWSTTVNGRTHQQTPLTTYGGYQYVTYFDAERRLCIGRRKLPTGSWQVIQFKDHKFETNDSHNTSVIGICAKDGTIHMAFDHHASQLNYRVSKLAAAHDPDSVEWTAELFGPVTHSLGSITTDAQVTYPRFVPGPNGNLMLYYRAVTSGNGDGMIEEYDGDKHDWTPGLGRFIARDVGTYRFRGRTSHYRCPYMNSLSYAGNRLHASWIWRDRFEKTHPINQHDLCYAYSDDHGRTWMNSDGQPIGKTGVNGIHLGSPGLVVAPINSYSGLSNSNTHFAFADGSIHIVMRRNLTGTREGRYHHYWRTSAGEWGQQVLPFTGSRPKLVGSSDRSLILVYADEREDETEWLSVAKGHPNRENTHWQWDKLSLPKPQSVCGEPLVDLERWQSENVLSVYVQEEPRKRISTERDEAVDGFPSPLHVLDYRLVDVDHERLQQLPRKQQPSAKSRTQ